MADQVTTTFTADTGQLDAALANVLERIGRLEAGSQKASVQVGEIGNKSKVAATELTGLAGAFESANRAGAGLGTTMELIGAESSGAAQKIRLMNVAIKELAAASAPLLILMVALEGVAKAMDFLKDGVKNAEDMQNALSTMGAAVTAQGGNWDELKDKTEAWLDVEMRASGFTKGELVESLNSAVTAGNSLADSQTLVAVAEELARSKHISVEEATQKLITAEAGRTKGLVALDLNVAKLAKSHASFSTILGQLHKDMQGSLNDDQNAQLANARLHNEIEAVGEVIGTKLLPMLANMSYAFLGAIENAKELGAAVGQIFTGIGGVIEHAAAAAEHFAMAMLDLTTGNFKGALDQFKSVGNQVGAGWDAATTAVKGFGAAWNGIAHGQDAATRGRHMAGAAVAEHSASLTSGIANFHGAGPGGAGKHGKHGAGHHGAHGGSTPFSAGIGASGSEKPEDVDALAKAHDALASSKTLEDAATKALNATINQSLDTKQLDDQKTQAEYAAYVKAEAGIKTLTAAVDAHKVSVQGARQAQIDAYGEYNKTTQALQQVQNALQGKTKLTVADHAALKEAQDAQKLAEKAYTDADTALKKQTKSLDDHEKQLAKDTDTAKKFIAAQQALVVAMNDTREKAQQAQKDDEATHGLSLQQQIAYYQQRYDIAHNANLAYFNEHHAYNAALVAEDDAMYTKLLGLQTQEYNSEVDNAKKHHDDMVKNVSTFLDDVIVKHKSFKDALKSIYDQILQAFISMVAKMIAESALFKSIFGNLGGGGGGLLGGIASIFGGGGGGSSSAASSAVQLGASAANPLHVNIAQQGGTAVSGFTSTNPINNISPVAIFIGAGMAGGAIGGALTAGGDPSRQKNANIGGFVGAAAGGVGALALGLGGGAMGGLGVGLSMFTPAGWALLLGGALLGGAVGGLFGNHFDPKNQPDIGDTANFGQMMANLGTANDHATPTTDQIANGQHFNIDPAIAKATGGLGEGMFIKNTISGLSDSQGKAEFGSEWDHIKSMFSGWSENGVHLHDGKWNGFDYKDMQQTANDALQAIQANTAQTAANTIPIFQVDRLGPDFNTARMGSWNATVARTTQPVAIRPDGPLVTPGGSPGTSTGNGTVTITIGTLVGSDGMNELADIIDKHQTRNQYYNYNNRGYNG